MTSTTGLTNDQYLALEAWVRAIVETHLNDLRTGIMEKNIPLLTEAVTSLQESISAFPEEHLDFFANEVVMILAANSPEGPLLLGEGEL
jgi:hypothetical protein